MRIETHGQQIDVTPAMRDYVESKLARLGRHFEQPLDVRTTLAVDKPDHRAEATLSISRRKKPSRRITDLKAAKWSSFGTSARKLLIDQQ